MTDYVNGLAVVRPTYHGFSGEAERSEGGVCSKPELGSAPSSAEGPGSMNLLVPDENLKRIHKWKGVRGRKFE